MKLFWEFADFHMWECCKNNQIKNKYSSLKSGGALTDVI